LENCHPYPILPNKLALMHNGVLSTGNRNDVTKSDTWHFIEDYLKMVAEAAPQLFYEPNFLELLEKFIGYSNKFVFMNDEGRLAVVNEEAGTFHAEMWFSNTYAWSPSRFIPDYWKGKNGGNHYRGGYNNGYEGGSYGQTDRSNRVFAASGFACGKTEAPSPAPAPAASPAAPAPAPAPMTAQQEYEAMLEDYGYAEAEAGMYVGNPFGAVSAYHERKDKWSAKESIAKDEAQGKGDAGKTNVRTFPDSVFSQRRFAAHDARHVDDDYSADKYFDDAARKAQAEWLTDRKTRGVLEADSGADQSRVVGQSGHQELLSRPTEEELVDAVQVSDVDALADWLMIAPATTLTMMFKLMTPVASKHCPRNSLAKWEQQVYDALLGQRVSDLIDFASRSYVAAERMGEVIGYYLNWIEKAIPSEHVGEVREQPTVYVDNRGVLVPIPAVINPLPLDNSAEWE
jgi:hypothetical protein